MLRFCSFCVVMLWAVLAQSQTCRQVIGYCANWQWYDRAHLMNPTSIPYSKYSVLNYSFFRPQASGHITSTDDWADQNLLLGQINWQTTPPTYIAGTNIPDNAHAVGTKVVISVGGWSDSNNFPAIAASAAKRAIFAHDCVVWVDSFNLDGVDIDWEYPGYAEHNGTAADKPNFTLLLQQIRDSLNVYEVASGKEMLLTACFGAAQSHMSNINWSAVVPILDYVNLMSYDFYGTWDATANHNAPLHAPTQGDPNFCIEGAVNLLTGTYGVSPSKINAGTAFYGRSAKTTGTPALFGPINGTVDGATFSADEGSPTYYNVLQKLSLFNTNYDAVAGVPYLTGKNGLNTFVSYDNPQSIAAKAQFIVDHNLAGAIIWEISGDMVASASNTLASTPLLDTLNAVFCGGPSCANVSGLSVLPTMTALTFSWVAPSGVDSVSVRYKTAAASTWITVKRAANAAFTVSGLPLCTAYVWEVKSQCGTQLGDYVAGAATSTLCCNVPASLAALPAPTSAQLTWIGNGANSYNIRWKLKTGTAWTTISNIATASYNLVGLANCTEYHVQVRAKCGTTFGAWSASKLFKTTACTTCDVPTQTTTSQNGTSTTFVWANTGATYYQLRYKLTSASAWTSASNITANNKIINGLVSCANYTWQVRGNCNGLWSAYSTAASLATSGCCVAAINARTTSIGSTTVTLKWTGAATSSYELSWRNAANAAWTSATISNDTAYILNGLTSCTGYQFKVRTLCTPASSWTSDVYFATSGCANCEAPPVKYFSAATYTPIGEIKVGQGRLYPVWGVSADAFIPQNRVSWAIANVHAAHLFRLMSGTSRIPNNFYFATAAKESFCGCDNGIVAAPAASPFPFSFQAASLGDGCFQIENNSAYNELKNLYPQRYPTGQHANLIGGHHYTTAAISKAYYDIFAVKYWDIVKGYNPTAFFNQATDSNAVIKLMAIAYNRGLWYTGLATVLNTDRTNALAANTISPYFNDNSYGYDYQNALTQYCQVLGNQANLLPANLTANNPATGQPYNSFVSFYNPSVTWNDVNEYIDSIAVLYPEVNIPSLKSKVQAVFNAQNNGAAISFRYNLGSVLDALVMALPADDPTSNLAVAYGCNSGGGNPTGGTCATPATLSAVGIGNSAATLTWQAASNASGYNLRWKVATASTWTDVANLGSNTYSLAGLTACTDYVWQVQALCAEGPTTFTTDAAFQTIGCNGGGGGTPPAAPNSYCSLYSVNSTAEWVQTFSIGSYTKNSGNNNGFGNFIDQTTLILNGNTSVTCSVSAAYSGTPQTQYIKVWIDWNRDGDFDDADENVLSGSTNTTTAVSQNVTIPANVSYGYARMRVATRRGTAPLTCDVYLNGETEDYVVQLQPISALQSNFGNNAQPLQLFPNPGKDAFTLVFDTYDTQNYQLDLLDAQGSRLLSQSLGKLEKGRQTHTVSQLGALPTGLYLVVLRAEGQPISIVRWQKIE